MPAKKFSGVTCSVFGCQNSYANTRGIEPKVVFYSFPNRPWESERKKKWIRFVRLQNADCSLWVPQKRSSICSRHFFGNEKSQNPENPSYNPTIFKENPAAVSKTNPVTARFERAKKRRQASNQLKDCRLSKNTEDKFENDEIEERIGTDLTSLEGTPWIPTKSSSICSEQFVGDHPYSLSFCTTIFDVKQRPVDESAQDAQLDRMAQSKKRSLGANDCSVSGCENNRSNTVGLEPPVRFFAFPGDPLELERKEKWIEFVQRENEDGSRWVPTAKSKICSRHFVGNTKSNDAKSPSYNPKFFLRPDDSHDHARSKSTLEIYERAVKRRRTEMDEPHCEAEEPAHKSVLRRMLEVPKKVTRKARVNTNGCSVFGCKNNYNRCAAMEPPVHFFKFPSRSWEVERRKAWIRFCRRQNLDKSPWVSTKSSKICSRHFVGNQRSETEAHPSYNPMYFDENKRPNEKALLSRFNRLKKRRIEARFMTDQNGDVYGDRPVIYVDLDMTCEPAIKEISCQTEEPNCEGSLLDFHSNSVGGSASTSVQHRTQKDEQTCTETVAMIDRLMGPNRKTVTFLGYKSVKYDEEALKYLTSVSPKTFNFLLSFLVTERSRCKSLCLRTEDRLLMFLMKVKFGLPFQALSTLFGVCHTTAKRIFSSILDMLVANRDEILSCSSTMTPEFVSNVMSLLDRASIHAAGGLSNEPEGVGRLREEFARLCFGTPLQTLFGDQSVISHDIDVTGRMATAGLLRRFKDVISRYVHDDQLGGKVPLPSHRMAELAFVLKALSTLTVALKKAPSKSVSKDVCRQIVDLYPKLVECTTSSNPQVTLALKEVLAHYHDMMKPRFKPAK